MAFHEIRFPARLSAGSTGGPERRVEVVTMANGFEARNAPWRDSRRRYDAGLGVQSLDDLAEVVAFWEGRRGRLHGFRWRDWLDWKSCAPSGEIGPGDQVIGTGDGETRDFQLSKTYRAGPAPWSRPIAKPVAGTVRVALDGIEQPEAAAWTVDAETGVVSFTLAPEAGREVTAGFEFDVPVRFDAERLELSLAAVEAGEALSIPVVEVRI